MNKRFFISISMAFVIGAIGGFFVFKQIRSASTDTFANCQMQYEYINEQLGCRSKTVIKKHEYTAFIAHINEYISNETKANHAQHVSVYFRDLQYGPTFGITEKDKFIPASLLKVPVLITYLNFAETHPEILSKKLSYNNPPTSIPEQTLNKNIPKLEENTPYTIETLLSQMIKYSDNTAYFVLDKYLAELSPSEDLLTQTLIDLGHIDPWNPTEDLITVKAYSSMFRQLYNSSYLSPEMSEKALSILSKSEYPYGLVAGVPQEIKVAHKFGERSSSSEEQKQLHDCGIVYYPNNPYLLCIMTRGNDFNQLQQIISTISEKVYKEVDSRRY
jgi:beta-lactamase class A